MIRIIHTEYQLLMVQHVERDNLLLNVINNQPDFDKIYPCVQDPCESKHQLLINKREKSEIKHRTDTKSFTDYSEAIDNDHAKNITEKKN